MGLAEPRFFKGLVCISIPLIIRFKIPIDWLIYNPLVWGTAKILLLSRIKSDEG